eukprot:1189599-Prorocentrum_minimum.AAC.5
MEGSGGRNLPRGVGTREKYERPTDEELLEPWNDSSDTSRHKVRRLTSALKPTPNGRIISERNLDVSSRALQSSTYARYSSYYCELASISDNFILLHHYDRMFAFESDRFTTP